MKNTIRMELHKVFRNKILLFSIATGLVLCGMDVVENIYSIQQFHEILQWLITTDLRAGHGHSGYSLFYSWMGVTNVTRGASFYCIVWPVLAAMAYGWSYNSDRRSGVYDQIVVRSNAKTYYVAKYISVFVSGGLAVSVPLLANLLANALVCPYAIPKATIVHNGYFLSELFYTCPWAYGLIWCGMVFLIGGATACICFVAGTKLRHGVMLVLVPYVLYIGFDALVATFFPTLAYDLGLNVYLLFFIQGGPGFPNPEWFVFTVLAVLIGASFSIGYWQVVKHELV